MPEPAAPTAPRREPAGPDREPVRLLVCAFGPFPGVAVNPSERFARAVLRRRRPSLAGVACDLEILPTRWEALGRLSARIARERPDGILLLGVAPRRRRIDVETRAVNAASWRPDAARRHFPAARLAADGPAVRATTAPVARLIADLRRSLIAAGPSRDAGRYLCNASYYVALAGTEGTGTPVVFVHLPGRSGMPAGVTSGQMITGLSDLLVSLAHAAARAARMR